jgi:hypothetical protein
MVLQAISGDSQFPAADTWKCRSQMDMRKCVGKSGIPTASTDPDWLG